MAAVVSLSYCCRRKVSLTEAAAAGEFAAEEGRRIRDCFCVVVALSIILYIEQKSRRSLSTYLTYTRDLSSVMCLNVLKP